MENGTDIPPTPLTLFINGEEVGEGTFVIMTGDSEDEAGEVWGVDAFRRRVLVSWPIKRGNGYRYWQDWQDADELTVLW
jgi:hypothetical protein